MYGNKCEMFHLLLCSFYDILLTSLLRVILRIYWVWKKVRGVFPADGIKCSATTNRIGNTRRATLDV